MTLKRKTPKRESDSTQHIRDNLEILGRKKICSTVELIKVKCLCKQIYWTENKFPTMLCADCGESLSRGEPGVPKRVKHLLEFDDHHL